MKKSIHSRAACFLLALLLLMQNLTIPVHANGDRIPEYCTNCCGIFYRCSKCGAISTRRQS